MKRIYSLLLLFLLVISANCILLDETGYSDSFTGKEAKQKIKESAAGTDYIIYFLDYTPEMTLLGVLLNQAILDILLKIDESKYYNKEEVRKCASDIARIGGGSGLDSVTALPFLNSCNRLEPNGPII